MFSIHQNKVVFAYNFVEKIIIQLNNQIASVLEKQFLTVFLTAIKAADGYSVIHAIIVLKKSC